MSPLILTTQTAAVLLAVALTVSSETVVTVTGNPHAGQCDASVSATATSSSSQHGGGGIALGFSHLITPVSLVRTALPTQTDTLFAFTTPRLLGAPTPVYAFRQSPRLPGSRELPFKILNVWTLAVAEEEQSTNCQRRRAIRPSTRGSLAMRGPSSSRATRRVVSSCIWGGTSAPSMALPLRFTASSSTSPRRSVRRVSTLDSDPQRG